jgi:hypothetical protein
MSTWKERCIKEESGYSKRHMKEERGSKTQLGLTAIIG